MRRYLWLLLLLLAACGRGSTTQQPSPNNGWQNFANGTTQLTNPFSFSPLIGYVITTPRNLGIGRTIELNYTVFGDGNLATPNDNPPAQITLLLWRAGDNISGENQFEHYRLWCRSARGPLTPGDHMLSCAISEDWTGVKGRRVGDFPGMLQQAINNVSSIGFSCGGRDFFGKGCSGGGSMRIISFNVR